jgi:hypothetical protein
LLAFLSIGVGLEALHGLKIGWYLKPAFETRRLMWTLGHAHGALLALIHALFAASLLGFVSTVQRSLRWASPCLISSSILLPGGFFLGGTFIYGGDPGIGIALVPLGALTLFLAILLVAISISRNGCTDLLDHAVTLPPTTRSPRKPNVEK